MELGCGSSKIMGDYYMRVQPKSSGTKFKGRVEKVLMFIYPDPIRPVLLASSTGVITAPGLRMIMCSTFLLRNLTHS